MTRGLERKGGEGGLETGGATPTTHLNAEHADQRADEKPQQEPLPPRCNHPRCARRLRVTVLCGRGIAPLRVHRGDEKQGGTLAQKRAAAH